MWAWLVLLLLIIAEVVGIRWWLRKEFYPAFFNGWAVLIYCSTLAADFIVAWLISMLYAWWHGGAPRGWRYWGLRWWSSLP